MLVMADVAGKSVPAALLMATLQASLRTLASERLSLPELATRLNHYASAHSLDGQRFTTAVLGEYDPQIPPLHLCKRRTQFSRSSAARMAASNVWNPAACLSESPAKPPFRVPKSYCNQATR